MGLFSKSGKKKVESQRKTIIASGSNFTGLMQLQSPAHLDGSFSGRIYSTSDVSIGKNGRMEGFLRAEHVIISGAFLGQLDCKILEVASDGSINGDIHAQEISFEAGCHFSGTSYDYNAPEFRDRIPSYVQDDLNTLMDNEKANNEKESNVVVMDSFKGLNSAS